MAQLMPLPLKWLSLASVNHPGSPAQRADKWCLHVCVCVCGIVVRALDMQL